MTLLLSFFSPIFYFVLTLFYVNQGLDLIFNKK